ncbi:hypothetical protein [Brachyspira hampsonii]|uniref:Uncharacterized protein n=1 Tax=Brachyspira hampsonii TaxID=1287055 RepID=A0A1E5NQM9_9SPIR|nr:hypothetical protein [Brachyspira hampsonii]ASJ21563.1 hypothetical protein BHAMNSH16_07865 [Brachyspira hampsonii]ELV05256.1 hypothetical protein H263_11345 [Brachyspira hampsonii 30599]OEJ15759.1 hypothetical protein BFL38_09845 [Brachyspira hampsonii]OEJ18480.1 hypothetical protein A9496_07430 [Brachyspira hampsonii]
MIRLTEQQLIKELVEYGKYSKEGAKKLSRYFFDNDMDNLLISFLGYHEDEENGIYCGLDFDKINNSFEEINKNDLIGFIKQHNSNFNNKNIIIETKNTIIYKH